MTATNKSLFNSLFFRRGQGEMKNQKTYLLLSLIIKSFTVLFLIVHASVSSAQTYAWSNIAMGGTGMVIGIIPSKTQQNLVYARTDVGGAYKWDNTSSMWVPLLDWCSDNQKSYQGVEALALDPQNSSKLYMLVGTSYWNSDATAILRSSDYGATFSITDVTAQFKASGNASGRGNGERLAVDPNNSNILYCGTRANGLWKSTDAGATWTQIWNGVTTTTNGNGICFVVFDGSSVSGGVTQRIFVGISRTGAATPNLYMSTNGGTSFTAVSGIPTTSMPIRAALGGGYLYITYSTAEGPYNAGCGGSVKKYNIATPGITDVTPSASYGYGGISIDPANASRIIVSTYGCFNTSQYTVNGTTAWGEKFYLSTNGGTSWTDLVGSGITVNNNGIPWINGNSAHAIHYAASIEFDPYNTASAWVASGNGLFQCTNLSASPTTWSFDVKGLEESVPLDIVVIPGGPVGTAIGDYDGFIQSNVATYVKNHNPGEGSNSGIAFAWGLTTKMLRSTADCGSCPSNNHLYYSTDQGVTWTGCTANKGASGKVAICADGSTMIHCPGGSSTTYYSTNNGGTWTSTGVTTIADAFPVADPANTNYVYMYDQANTGKIYVSSNKGVSYTASGAPGTWGSKRLAIVPGNEGNIWIAMYGNGLKYSADHGATFTTISGVTFCAAVGVGKIATSATYPTLYIWGTVGGTTGVYRSTDKGVTWTRINDDAHQFGGVYQSNAEFVTGDMNIYGRVYLSTVGRGVVYGDVGATTPVTLISFDGSFDGDDIVKLNWEATSEINLNGYKLFRTLEAASGTWKEIAFIASVNATNNIQTYSYFDSNLPSASTIYYKLVSVENNGSAGVSRIIALKRDEKEVSMEAYPNPSNDFFYVKINGDKSASHVLQLFDIVGQKIEEVNMPSGTSTISIGRNFSPGIYFLKLKGTEQKTIKLIKQ
jgi:xyloglucan-specific exo-beta-1,4-glucanase